MWQQILGEPALYRAQYKADFGQPWSALLQLDDKRWLAFSPGPELLDSALALMGEGAELLIVAPASAHTMGVRPWLDGIEGARVFASDTARPRLASKCQCQPEPPDALAELLPTGVRCHEPPDAANGELWIEVESGNQSFWLVCDVFLNLPEINGGFIQRMLIGLYGLKEGLALHRNIGKPMVKKGQFVDWARDRFAADRKQVLVPCHGDVLKEENTGPQMLALLG